MAGSWALSSNTKTRSPWCNVSSRARAKASARFRGNVTPGCSRVSSLIAEIAQRREISGRTVIGHLEKLAQKGEDLQLDHLMPSPDRFARIKAAFERAGDQFLAPARELLGEEFSYDEIQLARLGLQQKRV